MNNFEYKEEYKYLTNICLNITDDCNLACKYCFVEQHPHYMNYETAKQSIDFLVKNLRHKKEQGWIDENQHCKVNFFGGEPMLLWDEIIVPIIKYAQKEYPKEVEFGMTTNGTLFTPERIDFLKKHNVGILLSIDGAPETQNYNRPCKNNKLNSFDLIIKNIPYLLEKYPNTTFRSTINQDTVSKTFENYIFASYLGFNNIFIMPNGREKWTEGNKQTLKEEVKKIFAYIESCFLNNYFPIGNTVIDKTFEYILLNDLETIGKRKKTIKSIRRSPQRCGLGTSMGSIGYDGKIYGCQEQNSKDNKNIFLIGDIFNGIDTDKHFNLLKLYTQKQEVKCSDNEKCKNCYLKNICTGLNCPSSSWDLFNSFFIDNEISCEWRNYLFENALNIMEHLVSLDNLTFKEYLDNKCNYKKYF